MGNPLFSHVSSDYYTRYYKLNPAHFGNLPVEILALCTQNVERINDEYYWLDLYYSIDEIGVLDYLIGVSFGGEQMDQKSVDNEMDDMVNHMITDPGFPAMLQNYLKMSAIVEDAQTRELMERIDAPDDNIGDDDTE